MKWVYTPRFMRFELLMVGFDFAGQEPSGDC